MRWSRGSRSSRRSTPKSWTRSSTARRPKPPQPLPRQRRNTPAPPPLIVAGRGNLGRSLARGLRAAGHPVRLVSARAGLTRLIRDLESKGGAVVFLTVPDGAVAAVAAKLAAAGAGIPDTVGFVHASGALQLGALAPLGERHPVGSFHPLRSFPGPGPPWRRPDDPAPPRCPGRARRAAPRGPLSYARRSRARDRQTGGFGARGGRANEKGADPKSGSDPKETS